MCLLGVIKLKFNIKPLFIPQNCQILAQNTLDLIFFRLKMLNNGGTQEETTLNHHRSSIKVA